MGALIQLAVLCLIVCFVYISKKDKSSKTADKLSIKEKYLLLAVGAVILIGLFTFALSNGLKPNDLTLLLIIFIVIASIFFVIKFIFQKLTSIQQNSSSSIMEKKDEIEKLNQENTSNNIGALETSSSSPSIDKLVVFAVIFASIVLCGFIISNTISPFSKSTQNKTGQDGFIASIECRFGMIGGSYAEVPFQSCAMYGEIIVISGNSRQSYSKYQIPEIIYLPQYFQMSIDNASDKFTTIIKIIDKKTGNVVSVREVGPNSYDIIQN